MFWQPLDIFSTVGKLKFPNYFSQREKLIKSTEAHKFLCDENFGGMKKKRRKSCIMEDGKKLRINLKIPSLIDLSLPSRRYTLISIRNRFPATWNIAFTHPGSERHIDFLFNKGKFCLSPLTHDLSPDIFYTSKLTF